MAEPTEMELTKTPSLIKKKSRSIDISMNSQKSDVNTSLNTSLDYRRHAIYVQDTSSSLPTSLLRSHSARPEILLSSYGTSIMEEINPVSERLKALSERDLLPTGLLAELCYSRSAENIRILKALSDKLDESPGHIHTLLDILEESELAETIRERIDMDLFPRITPLQHPGVESEEPPLIDLSFPEIPQDNHGMFFHDDIMNLCENISKTSKWPINVLVCGRAGVGKSSLINTLVRKEVCEVNDTAVTNLHSTIVNATVILNNSVVVNLFNSPGMQDSTDRAEDYLKTLPKDFDLAFYCIDMTISRLTMDDEAALKMLAKIFGKEFWSKCILVMTKSNLVFIPRRMRKARQFQHHQNCFNVILNGFKKCLEDLNYPSSLTGVCAGRLIFDEPDEEEHHIWFTSEHSKDTGHPEDFFPEFWRTVLMKLWQEPTS